MENYLDLNRKAWNQQVKNGNRWTLPVSDDEIEKARNGTVEVVLTPVKFVPADWLGELNGKNVLCLASGGGQQAPLLAAAGANVTVFDLSEEQLNNDKITAKKYNLPLKTVRGDMADLSVFENDTFDLIFHPCSNCFIPKVKPVWKEAFRVLKPGGVMLAGFNNPVMYLYKGKENPREMDYQIVNKIPYADLEQLTSEEKAEFIKNGYPFEFGHTLEDQIGGQIEAGFLISGFFEDRYNEDGNLLDEAIPIFIATKALKPF